MSLFSVFFIGVGLAMDACAVSFAKGMCLKRRSFAMHGFSLSLSVCFKPECRCLDGGSDIILKGLLRLSIIGLRLSCSVRSVFI